MKSLGIRTDVSGAYNSSTNFNVTYTGINVASGMVHAYRNIDNYLYCDYSFLTWNSSFISEHPELTVMSISYNDAIFGSIPMKVITTTKTYQWLYTYTSNEDLYIGFNNKIPPYSWTTTNQAGWFNSIIDSEFIDTSSWIQFEGTPYNEYDNAIVNFSVETIMENYPDKLIYLEIATPKKIEPFYNYAAYELSDYTGYRGLAIEGKHPTYDVFHNCSAYIRAYDQDMGDYETLLEIEQSVLWDNHTLLNYTGYDYPTNKSYVTGSSIGIDVDIMEYIETDFLYSPDEHFLLHIHAFSNSNQGNREYEYHIDPKYWDAEYYHTHHFSCQPFSSIDSDFNATIQSYITVYRNGNLTRLTPTINTSMWSSGYIPEGEEGYNPPDIPEEPEDPDTGENETLPENPDIPDIPTVTNQSINTSWVYYYYEEVNNSFDTLLAPVYNFIGYTLTPIYLLNDSISDYNYIMNESFAETTQKINILSGSFNIIYNSFHPKIIGVITYYLIWLVLLIILKKR
jgi:hypothetical protein